MAERMTNDLFELVHTMTLLGYSDGTFVRVACLLKSDCIQIRLTCTDFFSLSRETYSRPLL